MAVEFNEDENGQETGGQLRQKLEAALSTNRKIEDELQAFRAKELLSEKGLDLVKPEDLKGVDPSNLESRASEIQTERRALQENLLRQALAKQGLEGEALDELVGELVGQKTTNTEDAETVGRMRQVGGIGEVLPRVDPSKVQGYDAIRAGIEANARKTKSL